MSTYITGVEKFLCELCVDFPSLKKGIDSEMETTETLIVQTKKPNAYNYLTQRRIPVEGSTEKTEKTEKTETSLFSELATFIQVREVLTSKYICTPEKRNKIVKGYVQSKKTWAIISIALYYLFKYRKSSFIIVRNNIDDFVQIKGRITGVLDYLFTQGGAVLRKEIEHLFHYLDVNRGRCATPAELTDSFSGVDPRIYVCMRNNTDLVSLHNNMKNVSGDFSVIIDEIDDIDNGRDAESQLYLEMLKERSGSIWGVTATPMTSLMKDQIEQGNVFVLSRPEWYKDIPNFDFRDLPLSASYATKVEHDLFDFDPNLKGYLADFSKTQPFECPVWKQNHPRIALLRVGAAVEPQLKVASYIEQEHPGITVITYNGSAYGITLRGQGVTKEAFKGLSKFVSTATASEDGTESSGYHIFTGMHISEVIGVLEKRGVALHPRIIILAGKKADRGISFVSSSFADVSLNRIKWHLTELYLVVAKSTSQSNLLQIAGRLCGVFRDNIPLTIFSNAGEDIIKAYWVQDELIERAREIQGSSLVMREIIPEVPISHDKCTTRRITSTGVSCSLTKVFEDYGWDWEAEGKTYSGSEIIFGEGIRSNTVKRSLTAEELEFNREVYQYIREMRGPLSLDSEEVARITQKMFPVWAHASTKIAKFIQNICPRKIYTRKEIEEECNEYGVRLTDCFTRDGQLRTKYGNLFKVVGNTFQLYPELVEAFERNFNSV